LLEGAIAGLAYATQDPYTIYYSKENMQLFDEKSQGRYCGIGITVKSDANGILTVIDTFENSPARAAGLMGGDKIIKVDAKDVTTTNDEDIVINLIKGTEGTNVNINIYRPSQEEYLDFIVTRKEIKVENIKSEIFNKHTGYIKISMFGNNTAKEFGRHLSQMIKKGITRLIIDVRDNPGGNYSEVVRICDMILPKDALIVYTENREGKRFEDRSDKNSIDMPIIVLINSNSASASEILAGSLKDNNKARLLGEQTYGKGLVQTIHRFYDGSGIKYTVSRYFTPSGSEIDKIGIKPDVEVKFDNKYKDKPVSQIPRNDDIQLIKAKELISLKSEKITE
jgi:carboxyl-terminal processing protease